MMPDDCTSRARQLTVAGSLIMSKLWHLKQRRGFGIYGRILQFTYPAFIVAGIFELLKFKISSVSSGTPKRGTTSRLTGAGSLLPLVYSEAWDKGNAEVSIGHQSHPYGRSEGKGNAKDTQNTNHFPPYGTLHKANMRVG
ncbi:hypothetical protein TNCV_1601651 [Trichonephila clavipes]|nr:hypothetical protein TNCV_1601651 [Trichonephila clavipes]